MPLYAFSIERYSSSIELVRVRCQEQPFVTRFLSSMMFPLNGSWVLLEQALVQSYVAKQAVCSLVEMEDGWALSVITPLLPDHLINSTTPSSLPVNRRTCLRQTYVTLLRALYLYTSYVIVTSSMKFNHRLFIATDRYLCTSCVIVTSSV